MEILLAYKWNWTACLKSRLYKKENLAANQSTLEEGQEALTTHEAPEKWCYC